MLTDITENDQNHLEDELIFNQDGASPYYALLVHQHLNQHFLDHWTGKRYSKEWPSRSPNLFLLEFCLWGHLETRMYSTSSASLKDLRDQSQTNGKSPNHPRNTTKRASTFSEKSALLHQRWGWALQAFFKQKCRQL